MVKNKGCTLLLIYVLFLYYLQRYSRFLLLRKVSEAQAEYSVFFITEINLILLSGTEKFRHGKYHPLKEACKLIVCKDRSLILIGCLLDNNFISIFRIQFSHAQGNQPKEINCVLCCKSIFIPVIIAQYHILSSNFTLLLSIGARFRKGLSHRLPHKHHVRLFPDNHLPGFRDL